MPDCALANFDYFNEPGLECVGDTSQVGSYPSGASFYGVMDMPGNVWEWVNDCHSYDYYNELPNDNPTGPATGTHKVIRGGQWSSTAYTLRVASRASFYPVMPIKMVDSVAP